MADVPHTQVVVKTSEVEVATKADILVLNAKLSSLKAWGLAALLGGQIAAGTIAAVVGPRQAAQQVEALARAVGLV